MRALVPSRRALSALLALAAVVLLPASVLCAAESMPEGVYCPLMAAEACPMAEMEMASHGAAGGLEASEMSCCLAPEEAPPGTLPGVSPQVAPAAAVVPGQVPAAVLDSPRPRTAATLKPPLPPEGGLYILHAAFLI